MVFWMELKVVSKTTSKLSVLCNYLVENTFRATPMFLHQFSVTFC